METLDKILREHIDLLNKRQLDELYGYISKDDKSTFTDILYKCGLDPIKYFKDTIPAHFTYECGPSGEHVPTKIVLPKNITNIDDNAFCCNYTLQQISMPGVEYVWNWAFQDCENLELLMVPESVTNIGYNALANCRKLTLILPHGWETMSLDNVFGKYPIRHIHYGYEETIFE
jgi:hypothetical protein